MTYVDKIVEPTSVIEAKGARLRQLISEKRQWDLFRSLVDPSLGVWFFQE